MKSQKEYIQRASRCPCCDDSNIEGGFVEIDDGGAFQNVTCGNCSFSWVDNYKLIGFHYEREDIPPAPELTRHLSEEEIQQRRDNAAEAIRQGRQAAAYKGKT